MRRALTTVLVAGLGALTLTGTAVATADAEQDRSRRGGRVLEFDARFSDFFLLDFGPTGVREVTSFQDPLLSPSKGDQNVFEDVLLRDGEEVGAGSGSCVITEVGPAGFSMQCDVTYQLEGGQIAAQGRATGDPVKSLAIVGGTGRYAGAGGEVTLTEFGDGTGSVVLRLSRR
jgi:hypothetical protein